MCYVYNLKAEDMEASGRNNHISHSETYPNSFMTF